MIIEIIGPSAVGKTTLIRKLGTMTDLIWFPESLAHQTLPYSKPETDKNFIANQVWFVGTL